MKATDKITALLLVGGMGTRLRAAVPSLPKPLAPVAGRPFLEFVIAQLRSQGIRRCVLCTGYMADKVEETFGDGTGFGISIAYSRESEPLGTAGALRLAAGFADGVSPLLVLNGDTLLQFDLERLYRFHLNSCARVTMAAARVPDASRFGTIQVDDEGHVLSFLEKTGSSEPGLINAGVYLVQPQVLETIPEGYASWEASTLPSLVPDHLYAQEHSGIFIDIGIPSEYQRAQQISAALLTASQDSSAPCAERA